MTSKEFLDLLIECCKKEGYQESKIENRNKITFNRHDYSAINQQVYSQQFDLEGKVLWLDIPCNYKDKTDFRIQVCVRTWDKIKFNHIRNYDVNSVVIEHFFIHSNNQHGWTNIKVYDFNCKDNQKLCNKESKKLVKEYINPSNHTRINHFEPSVDLIETIMKMVTDSYIYLNTNIENDCNLEKGMDMIQFEKSSAKKRKIFVDYIKKDYKNVFESYLSIR